MTLMEELKKLLKEDTRFVDSEGNMLKNKIVEHALKLDENLIKLLLKNDRIKQHFFKDIDGVLILDKEKFMKFIDNKEFLPDSYTAFKNKIGLANEEGKYLAKSKEIVLAWPYKDCALEGGQEKPDEKRKEIFHNEILAPDEIDRLLEPKVFTNFKRIDKEGEHPLDGFRRDAEINRKRGLPEDTITDNLIIKGNNLLVLHSLLKEFREKVKLIYIDPPYYFKGQPKEDTFLYNSNFKLSTWLTFMKDRINIAKDLLSKDGAIFIQINNDGLAYLKVLMDEVFKPENFVNLVSIKTKSPSGFKTVNIGVFEAAEYILIYSKDRSKWIYNPQYVATEYDPNYKWEIINKFARPEDWEYEEFHDKVARELGFKNAKEAKKNIGEDIFNVHLGRYALEHADTVFRFTEINKDAGSDTLEIKELSLRKKDKVFVVKREQYADRFILNGKEITFYAKKVREIDGKSVPTALLTNVWTDISWEGIAKEGGVTLKRGKKPERLLKRILSMATNQGDIVLDFFMGTGTTCAVAHKMGRQYIGVEQLDYGENSAVVRLKNVISGDQTGISKEVSWQGGGDFVYMELMKLNESFVERIRDTETADEILNIWEDMKQNGFLSYRVDPKLFDENIEEFKALSLDEQKKLLLEMLEYNDLYVNYSEIDDAIYNVNEEDKKLNREFYKEK